MINLTISNASRYKNIPKAIQLRRWVNLVAQQQKVTGVIHLRIINPTESQALNQQFRHQNKPTNVLAFPFEPFPEVEIAEPILGDIAICAEIVAQEAKQQNKELTAHWAHLCIHGVLHLLGYDHETKAEAKTMEQLEINLLRQLGYENPYE